MHKKFTGKINPLWEQGAPEHQKSLALEFTGSASEYFRVWIVNLCLTLVTLGVFSAWAKVRNKRYIYSNLLFDGTPFQYLGRPIPILKGRLVALALFSVYYLSSNLFAGMMPYVLVAGFAIAPWVLIRSVAFNARYSAFRNMTFHFSGTYLKALWILSAWGIVPIIVAGIIFKWWGHYQIAAALFGLFGICFPFWIRSIKRFIFSETAFGGINWEFGATGGQFFKAYLVAGLIVLLMGIASGVAIAFAADTQSMVYVFAAPVYAGYILAFAYTQASLNNAVWNRMRLGPLSFRSSLRSGKMAILYMTNAIAIILSAGLLTPWASMRVLRYRIDNTRIFVDGSLSAFRGSEGASVQAAGAELGDFFDFDIAL